MSRKLRDRLSFASPNPSPQELHVNVPEVDPVAALSETAQQGYAAVVKLFEARNDAVKLSADLHRRNEYLLNANNTLRHQIDHAFAERDYYMQAHAKLSAHLIQCRDLINHMCNEVAQTGVIIERMPTIPKMTNNPDMPPVEASGLPARFNADGLPANGHAPAIADEKVQELINRLEAAQS